MLCKRNYLCNYTIEYQCCIFKSLILWHWNSWPVFIKCCFFFHLNIFYFFSLLLAQMSDEILFKKDEFKNIFWHWKLYFIDFFSFEKWWHFVGVMSLVIDYFYVENESLEFQEGFKSFLKTLNGWISEEMQLKPNFSTFLSEKNLYLPTISNYTEKFEFQIFTLITRGIIKIQFKLFNYLIVQTYKFIQLK